MDPATAFSLAVGVLQVIDYSFKVVKICRELAKDGSLAPHRNTEKLTDTLGMHVLVLHVLLWPDLLDAAYRRCSMTIIRYLANTDEGSSEGYRTAQSNDGSNHYFSLAK